MTDFAWLVALFIAGILSITVVCVVAILVIGKNRQDGES